MKSLIAGIIIFFIHSFSNASSNGQIKSQKESVIFIVMGDISEYAFFMDYKGIFQENISRRQKGTLPDTFKIEIDCLTQFRFPSAGRQNPVFAEPNDTIYINFQPNKLNFLSFDQNKAREKFFLIELEKINLGVNHLDLSSIVWHETTDIGFVFEELERLYSARVNMLDKHAASLHFTSKMRNVYKDEIELVRLLGYLQPFFKLQNRDKLPHSYYEKLDNYKEWISNDSTLKSCFWYRFALLSYNLYINRRYIDIGEDDFFRKVYFSTKNNYDIPTGNLIRLHILLSVDNKTTAIFSECLEDFLSNCPYPEYISYLNRELVSNKIEGEKLVKSTSFLKQELTDLNAIPITWENILISTKGSIAYIDLWASWCGPCRLEIPHSIKLQKELKKNDISFIYISIDNDRNKWLKAIAETGLRTPNKKHYLLDPNSELAKFMTSNGIPKYIIIGKTGAIEYLDAPRPSNPKIRELFDKLLKE